MSHQTDKDTHKLQRLEEKRLEAFRLYQEARDNHGPDSDAAYKANFELQEISRKIELHKPK